MQKPVIRGSSALRSEAPACSGQVRSQPVPEHDHARVVDVKQISHAGISGMSYGWSRHPRRECHSIARRFDLLYISMPNTSRNKASASVDEPSRLQRHLRPRYVSPGGEIHAALSWGQSGQQIIIDGSPGAAAAERGERRRQRRRLNQTYNDQTIVEAKGMIQ